MGNSQTMSVDSITEVEPICFGVVEAVLIVLISAMSTAMLVSRYKEYRYEKAVKGVEKFLN